MCRMVLQTVGKSESNSIWSPGLCQVRNTLQFSFPNYLDNKVHVNLIYYIPSRKNNNMESKGDIPNSTSFTGFEPFWLDLDANQTLSLAINDYDLVRIEEENLDFGIEVRKYLVNEIHFSWGEKILMVFEWLILELLGNGLIFGLVQYERLGADPMKRRLTDQVS